MPQVAYRLNGVPMPDLLAFFLTWTTYGIVASNREPEVARDQFKAWCTRKLKQQQRELGKTVREKWWTEGGSQRYINAEDSLEAVIHYVCDGQ